jgi:hypothetical protein
LNKKNEAKRAKYYADKDILPPECDELCRFRRWRERDDRLLLHT